MIQWRKELRNTYIILKRSVIKYTSFGQMISVVAINSSSQYQLRNYFL